MRIALVEGIHPSAVAYFRDHGFQDLISLPADAPEAEVAAALRGAQLVGVRSRTRLDAPLFAEAPDLMAVGCFCIGTDQVDLPAAATRGIPVFNAPHSNTRSVAELVIGFVIMLLRDAVRKNVQAHAGRWSKSAAGSREVRGKTLGIVGYGHIGSQLSVLAESMGMRVIYHDIQVKLPLGNAEPVRSLDALLVRSDIVTLHVPQTPETRGLIGAPELARMRRGAALINTSRGTVVDLEALAAALRQARLSGAAVDVFPEEPGSNGAPFDSPLRGIESAILTPHVAGSTQEAQEKIGAEVARKLTHYAARGATVGAVNFPELHLADHAGALRILHIHRNVPGVLRQINRIVAEEGLNIVGQHLQTLHDVGYVVLDVELAGPTALLPALQAIPGTIRTRLLAPGIAL
ncbi:MAG: phosphoglycerate dehydrogenase [Planctomycetaceae bacterium]